MESVVKRKILIFSTAYHPFVGGAEIAIKEITDRLKGDWEFDLITAQLQKDLPKTETKGSVTIYRIGIGNPMINKLVLPFFGAILAYKLNKQKKYFCFWAMMATFGSGAAYLSNIFNFFANTKRVPIVLSLQEGDSESHLKYRWGGMIALSWKLALRNTKILTAISNFLLNRAKKNGFKGESVLIPNGVDVVLFSKEISLETKEKLKKDLGKKTEDIFLVTTGRLVHKNGVDSIISALAKLPTHISLVVIGKGPEGSRLQRQAHDLGLSGRVKFLGFIPYDELPQYLSVCDIFIRPSRSEGFGNSFIEAMAAGLPVVATPVGGIPDFIDDKETGFFCSPDNPQSIAQAVNMILAETELTEKVVEQAFVRVKERYSWDHVALEMGRVFDTVIPLETAVARG